MNLIARTLAIMALLITTISSATAQELVYNIDFESYFDNREYSVMDEGDMGYRSGTDFGVRISPVVGLAIAEGNTLYFGIDALEPIGSSDTKIFDEVMPLIYYSYESESWSAAMGLFRRNLMSIDSYSTAFFADDYLYSDNVVGGVMGRYYRGRSFIEFVCDWESQPSESSRERFRLLSAGRKCWSMFYAGYNLSITHFAGQDAQWLHNVVDNILVNPCVGLYREAGEFDLDARVSYLQSLQRDRSYENEWLSPAMVELGVSLSYKGFSLDERCYIGDDLMPLYDGHVAEDGTVIEYGSLLYTGDPFFRTDGGFYNRAALSYKRSFLDDKISLNVAFITHATSGGVGTEQQLRLSINLGDSLYKKVDK